jgi:tryptophan synthase alpha chain
MNGRFTHLFRRLEREGRGALVPFTVLGDPDPVRSAEILTTIAAHADALEVGLPFSDPIADGPTIQEAALRARAAGTTVARAFALVAELRGKNPELPIGLLVYANLVHARGLEAFYAEAARVGIDAVLVPDVPLEESAPFVRAARRGGVAPVLIAPPNASEETLSGIARTSAEYTYVVTRKGITGVGRGALDPSSRIVGRLAELGAPPALLGFGLASPEDVRRALATGARGAIVGSALIERCTKDPASVPDYLDALRAATLFPPG